ncbi:RtcB family protein [Humisphaera borealis]|uniref:3'-phosphate/5'-hydroxy nucleic acid ligase n=1 Tax=Humisphaera borealis TaxID=2807512 RepID=A0A7M2WTX7_9BACT|nr:RtcB family protein [Humisphaera borealis]QOV88977.1 RtcB family protein [Humisphaera borealis]
MSSDNEDLPASVTSVASAKADPTAPTLATWLAWPLDTPVKNAIDRALHADDVVHVAVMPDVHLATDVCVGTAMATRRLVYPSAVGGDIGCGMLAIAFDATADLLQDADRAGQLLRAIGRRVPSHRRHRTARLPMPVDCVASDLSHPALVAAAGDDGGLQFGTLGGGNHFVELQADEDDRLWLMIHSGSRAMGQVVRSHHVARATRGATMPLLDTETDLGQAYLNDQDWARRYARGNRIAMAEQVCEAIHELTGVTRIESSLIECDHNHVRREAHFGESLLVHRKGATPADDGLAGVVPGSMGTTSVHIVGRGEPQSLRSSAHGAGRQMSRTVARERFGRHEVRRQMADVWYDPRILDAMREESPKAYKDLRAVLKAQEPLMKVTRRLRPLLVYKGS